MQLRLINSESNTLIERLKISFKNNPKLYQLCVNSSLSYIKRDTTTRLFNDFPCLLSTELLNSMIKHLGFILLNVQLIKNNEDVYMLSNQDENKIRLIENKLIHQAYRDLMQGNHLKKEMLSLCRWEPYQEKIDCVDVMCAYIGMVNGDIFNNMKKIIDQASHSYVAACAFINKNYRNWINEFFNTFQIDLKENNQFRKSIL